jgi:hypothetical protein
MQNHRIVEIAPTIYYYMLTLGLLMSPCVSIMDSIMCPISQLLVEDVAGLY